MTMTERKEKVAALIKQFEENEAFYTSKNFVESEVRNKFIDPFLECLKWDVKNEKGARHDRQEVITEDRVVIAGQVKHPDYTLCYGGMRKIYIEAKQPSVDLKTNAEPALQVRRYAYTSKMPIAILTDFQEFAIYDTRIKPNANDSAATARIEYLTYKDYAENFESLYNKISWDAVDLGKFDTYYEGTKDKRGTASVDDDILAMIEAWRNTLAEDIALHNEEADEYHLTGWVQKIIDRILFLRICEDKEIEDAGQLKKIADTKTAVYKSLNTLFVKANEKFNAGLFAEDSLLEHLNISDKTLSSIINALYYPECPYEFSVLPVEILGSIYERFLGKVIRFTRKTKNGHSVEIIEKPEVQKAGGVYYTPPYIVTYIVRQTIGKKCEGKTPEAIRTLRFLDPACGSGSFLVGAYQYLLDWHLDYYYAESRRASSEKKGLIYKDSITQEYKLSIEEKRRILLNNIYGVDIDAQAVEVTKLSLFLKLLENEGKALSSTGQRELFKRSDLQEKILPALNDNIKCGNSLVGSDYYADKDLSLFGIEEQRKINVFDWEKEFNLGVRDKGIGKRAKENKNGEKLQGFAGMANENGDGTHSGNTENADSVKKQGKPIEAEQKNLTSHTFPLFPQFDCVIGNPPYVRIQILNDINSDLVQFYNSKYSNIVSGNYDLYFLFIYKGFSLLKKDGILGFIQPHKFFQTESGKKLRTILYEEKAISQIVDFTTNQVFENATTYTCLLFLEKSKKDSFLYKCFELNEDFTELDNIHFEIISCSALDNSCWLFLSETKDTLLKKIASQVWNFKDITSKIFKGSSTGNDKIFLFDLIEEQEDILIVKSALSVKNVPIEKGIMRRFLYGEDVRRYGNPQNKKWLLFPYEKVNEKYCLLDIKNLKTSFPLAYAYLMEHKSELLTRKLPLTNNDFYKYSAARSLNDYEQPKILIPDMLVQNRIAYDIKGEFFTGPAIHCPVFTQNAKNIDIKLYLTILNSKLFWFFISNTSTALRGNAYRLTPEYLIKFSFPELDNNHPVCTRLISLAEHMIVSQEELFKARSESDKKFLQQRVDILDGQINRAVYELYGLSDEEIEIVEGDE